MFKEPKAEQVPQLGGGEREEQVNEASHLIPQNPERLRYWGHSCLKSWAEDHKQEESLKAWDRELDVQIPFLI